MGKTVAAPAPGGAEAPAEAAPAAAAEAAMPTGSREGDGATPIIGDGPALPPTKTRRNTPQSGILTAGSFDDNLFPRFYGSFLSKLAQNRDLGELAGRLLGPRFTVVVKDEMGQAIGNARVRVATATSRGGPELVTRSDGRAVFVPAWDELPADSDLTVTVVTSGNASPVTKRLGRGETECTVTVPAGRGQLPKALDLALVIDTTGSMGDELDFLKAEIRDIAAAIHAKFPQVEQRYALIVYRDRGDAYVTQHFDFTSSIDEFQGRLSNQRAGGGGDYPEAVEQALAQAAQLQWRSADTARVLFLVGDAPPHTQFAGKALAAANTLRKEGIAIYPVAASGTDDAAEFLFRTCAMLTGSQYLFLTDDSGVGNPHAEPHFPFYHVQRLDQLMVRMISGELAGRRLEPAADEIIRRVGEPPAVQESR
jgi:hypothetical protein